VCESPSCSAFTLSVALFLGWDFVSAQARSGGAPPDDRWNPQHIGGLPAEIREAIAPYARVSKAASEPEPKRLGLPAPLDSPPFPTGDWSLGGSQLIGVPDTAVGPLMKWTTTAPTGKRGKTAASSFTAGRRSAPTSAPPASAHAGRLSDPSLPDRTRSVHFPHRAFARYRAKGSRRLGVQRHQYLRP
jgi:hypothetical protein